jgi:outer membrane protein OmpU
MNKFKKIGLTALAGSLVATSAFAGELTATGSASIGVSNISGSADASTGKDWSMGNSVILGGSGELDNGMTVSMSFELDSGVDTGTGTGPFDNQSVTVSSDALGTLKFSGHGGDSAQGALDTTASGDIWDQTLGITGITAAASGDDSLHYTLPEVMEGLAISASLSPGRAAQESHTAYGLVYTGYDGLTVKYGVGDSGAPGTETESTTMMASYAIGPITASVSQTEADNTGAANRTVDSFGIAYTVSDELSISYGSDTFDLAGNGVDEEVEAIGVSYTSGGMTISANQYEAKGAGNSASAKTDKWSLSASFAF